MEFGLVLHDKSLVSVVDGLWKLCGNGVVSGLVLEHETLVAFNGTQDGWLLDGPCANVCPFFLCVLLFGVRCLPSRVPVIGELF